MNNDTGRVSWIFFIMASLDEIDLPKLDLLVITWHV